VNATLLGKELRQHAVSIIVLAVINLIAITLLLVMARGNPLLGSIFQILQWQLWILAVSAVILGNRLVVAEYQAQTQLFLEALPLPRWRMFLTKYLVGLFLMIVLGVAAFGAVLAVATNTEELSTPFVLLLLTRFLLFTWLCYGFFFLTGFLGKYRWGFYGLIVIGITVINMFTDIELMRAGPMKLVTGDFPFERSQWPTQALAITGGLIAFTFIATWLLACVREGSVAGRLGERISYREKMAFIVVLVGLFFTVMLAGEKRKKAPYDITEAAVASHSAISVKVTPQGDASQQLADRLASDLGAMAEFLDIEKLPPLFIAQRDDLDPDIFQNGYLGGADGIALRTNFNSPDWHYVNFLEHVVGDVLERRSNGRIKSEEDFWVIDGFCLYWAHSRAGENPAADPLDFEGERRNLWLRALYGTAPFGGPLKHREHILRWFTWHGSVGHNITAGIGWSGLVSLRDKVGEEKFRDFLRASLGRDTPENVTTTIRDLITSPEARLKIATGISHQEFLEVWNDQLSRARDVLGDEADDIPRLEGSFEFVTESEERDSFTGVYKFTAPANSGDLVRPTLLYGNALTFYPRIPSETLYKRQPLSLAPGLEEQSGSVFEDFTSGNRIAHTFAAYHRVLGCRIISGWQLTEVR
jgi:ABC-type transport system involved in multi-copper enzyme maturation permease subunit